MAANPGQVLYLVMEKGFIKKDIYETVLKTGSYDEGGVVCYLCDATGARVKPDDLTLQNSLFVYPGNPGQALENSDVSQEQWEFHSPTEPQGGGGLALMVTDLTAANIPQKDRGKVHPLPTMYDARWPGFHGDIALQDELGLFSVKELHKRNQEGLHVIIPVKPHHKDCVFKPEQAMVNIKQKTEVGEDFLDMGADGKFQDIEVSKPYYLAFWGNIAATPGHNNLAELYSTALRDLPGFTPEKATEQKELMQLKRDVLVELGGYAKAPFNFYSESTGKRAAVVGFLGGAFGHRYEEEVHALARQVHAAKSKEDLKNVLQVALDSQQEGGGYKHSIEAALRVVKEPVQSKSYDL